MTFHDLRVKNYKRMERNVLCSVWQLDSKGIEHERLASYTGSRWLLDAPECVAMKHKGKKLQSMYVLLATDETVIGIEARYTGGAVVTHKLQETL